MAKDNLVNIVKMNGSIGATNKALAPTWSLSNTYSSYGNSSDLWGETWAATDINDTNFGVVISAVADGISPTASIDYIRITVSYTIPGGTLTGISTLTGVQSITL